MSALKRLLIHVADWADDRVLQHRFYGVCQWIGPHPWWGNEP